MTDSSLTPGRAVDKMYTIDQKISAKNAEIEELKKERGVLESWILENVPKSDAEGIITKKAKAVITTVDIPTAKDWAAIYEHIQKTGDWDLVQKRLGTTAVRARWEEGEAIPGIDVFHKVSVKVTKLRG